MNVGVTRVCYLSETGVPQMPVITYFLCKNRSRDFLLCFYVWIVFYYNNYEENLLILGTNTRRTFKKNKCDSMKVKVSKLKENSKNKNIS